MRSCGPIRARSCLFMGQEFAQEREWDFNGRARLDAARRSGASRRAGAACATCNRDLPRDRGAARAAIASRDGLSLARRRRRRAVSVFAWLRLGGDGDAPVVVVANFTPSVRARITASACRGRAAGARFSTPTPPSMADRARATPGVVVAEGTAGERASVVGAGDAAAAVGPLADARDVGCRSASDG